MGGTEVMSGDWMCEPCNVNNFAKRTKCFKCQQPKEKDALADVHDDGVDNEFSLRDNRNHDNGRNQEIRDGDWACEGCGANNFARRHSCYKCKASKEGGNHGNDKFEFRNGDWSCSACGTHNFARRSACFQCRKQRPGQEGADWVCGECNVNNFARRAYCFGCQAPRVEAEPDNGGRYQGDHGNHGNHDNGYTERRPERRGAPLRSGDWNCSNCAYHNFAWRDTCNECGDSKGPSTERRGGAGAGGGGGVQPGDWTCPSEDCGENNFARRTRCYKCEASKPAEE